MFAVVEVDNARLRELGISIYDTGDHVMVVQYPPTPSGEPTKVLLRAKHRENTP